MMTSVSPDLLSFTGINRVLELIKINRELKTTLETYQDAKALKEQLDSTQQVGVFRLSHLPLTMTYPTGTA